MTIFIKKSWYIAFLVTVSILIGGIGYLFADSIGNIVGIAGKDSAGVWRHLGSTGGSLNVITVPSSTTANFYAIKLTNLTTASQNLAFGFTPRIVIVETGAANTDEICPDWLGATAVCPAANTAGDDRLAANRTITLDGYGSTSISLIAASGTQTVFVRAFR